LFLFLEGETNTHIYFTHGCATDCEAVLVFLKEPFAKFKDLQNVIDFNLVLGQVLLVTDSCIENEDKIYDLALEDLSRKKSHKITFNNICGAVYKPACIDTVIFSKTKVIVKTTLRENLNSEKFVSRTKQIDL
jgi:hypothetical protein